MFLAVYACAKGVMGWYSPLQAACPVYPSTDEKTQSPYGCYFLSGTGWHGIGAQRLSTGLAPAHNMLANAAELVGGKGDKGNNLLDQ